MVLEKPAKQIYGIATGASFIIGFGKGFLHGSGISKETNLDEIVRITDVPSITALGGMAIPQIEHLSHVHINKRFKLYKKGIIKKSETLCTETDEKIKAGVGYAALPLIVAGTGYVLGYSLGEIVRR